MLAEESRLTEKEKNQTTRTNIQAMEQPENHQLTALAFPPTCMHRSWNQFQLESNSVDLRRRRREAAGQDGTRSDH